MITAEELKKIVELANTVPEEYRQKCFELLLSYSLRSVTSPREGLSGAVNKPALSQEKTQKKFILPIDVKAFLSQYGLNESVLWKYFLVEGSEIRPIYHLKATQKARAQIQYALMIALETAISTGQFVVDAEKLRTRCQYQNCYDSANFMKNIKDKAELFKSIANDQPMPLSPVGKSELADLIEQLKD